MPKAKAQITKLLEGFTVGTRVQMHPATDLWMRGARYGDVVKVGRKYLVVKLDALPKLVRVHPDNLIFIQN